MPAHTHTLTHSLSPLLSLSLSLSLSFPSLINRHLIKSLFIKLGLCTAPPLSPCSTVLRLLWSVVRTSLSALPQTFPLHAICSARWQQWRGDQRRGVKTSALARRMRPRSLCLPLSLSLSLSLSVSLAHFGRFIRSPLHREINLIAGEGGGICRG